MKPLDSIGSKWRRGDSNPKRTATEPLQLDSNSTTEPNRQPSNELLASQHDTLPIQNNNSSEHQTGANMVHEITELPSDLTEIVQLWSELPEHIKAAIKALIQTHNKEIK